MGDYSNSTGPLVKVLLGKIKISKKFVIYTANKQEANFIHFWIKHWVLGDIKDAEIISELVKLNKQGLHGKAALVTYEMFCKPERKQHEQPST